ncbi:hypothetical protein OIO90_005587 [Microbotryomycetes sp. JL221]|nr:hypothetical protein OIO90_005587 [Microbotryomycetes sp. JL221]
MIIRRVARLLRIGKERYYVGSDLDGNAFYEWPSPRDPTDWRHAKRVVEYREERPLSDYQFVSIPVQWSAWMRRTRRTPPTMEELRVDAARQARLADNVEQLRLAYVEEKQRAQNDRDQWLEAPKSERSTQQEVEPGTRAPRIETETTGDTLGDEELAKRSQRQRERDRELLQQKKEAFARANPTFGVNKGNPSDTFQPEAWKPAAKPKAR